MLSNKKKNWMYKQAFNSRHQAARNYKKISPAVSAEQTINNSVNPAKK